MYFHLHFESDIKYLILGNGSEWRKVPTEGDTNNAEESQPAFSKETS